MKFKLKDISLYFNCCQNSKDINVESPTRRVQSCQNYPQKDSGAPNTLDNHVVDYLNKYSYMTMYATTITIGNKYYGSMSKEQQYHFMKKDIKKHIPYNSDEYFYLYTFELQKNGQLHAHGLTNVSQHIFTDTFGKYGKRNYHDKSHEKVHDLDSYIKYITKDQVFPYLTNITKRKEECKKFEPTKTDITSEEIIRNLDYGLPELL